MRIGLFVEPRVALSLAVRVLGAIRSVLSMENTRYVYPMGQDTFHVHKLCQMHKCVLLWPSRTNNTVSSCGLNGRNIAHQPSYG